MFEERVVPATYDWVGTTALYTTATNWAPNTPVGGPTANDTVIFGYVKNGVLQNNPCTIPATTKVLSAQMQNGYSATITLAAGVTWESQNGFTFNPGNAHINFSNAACELLADGGGSNLSNFTFSGANGDVMIRNGAQLSVATTGPATSSSTADWNIFGTLAVTNAAEMDFSNHGIEVFSGGQMSLGNKDGATQIGDGGGTAAIKIDSGGRFLFTGSAGTTSQLSIPLLNNGSATFNQGTLYFTHANASTSNYGWEMDSGTMSFQNGFNLKVQGGYYQNGGTLSTDAMAATITLRGTAPKAEIDGGNVRLGGSGAYGTLNVVGGNLNFNGGEFDADINGSGTGQRDQITDDSTISVGGASKLVVGLVGPLTVAGDWVLLVGTGADTAVWGGGTTLPTGISVDTSVPGKFQVKH